MIRYCLEYSTKFGECAAEIVEDDNGDYVRYEDADYYYRLAMAAIDVIDELAEINEREGLYDVRSQDSRKYMKYASIKLNKAETGDDALIKMENERDELIIALEDCIETLEYVCQYVSGRGLSAEDDCTNSIKIANDAINRIRGGG